MPLFSSIYIKICQDYTLPTPHATPMGLLKRSQMQGRTTVHAIQTISHSFSVAYEQFKSCSQLIFRKKPGCSHRESDFAHQAQPLCESAHTSVHRVEQP